MSPSKSGNAASTLAELSSQLAAAVETAGNSIVAIHARRRIPSSGIVWRDGVFQKMVAFSSDQWVIVALVFVLGLLIGTFLTAGEHHKWKTRYREESDRREALEREHRDQRAQWEVRKKEWRERIRCAAPRSRIAATRGRTAALTLDFRDTLRPGEPRPTEA